MCVCVGGGGGVVLGERLIFGEMKMKINKGSGRCSTGVWRITKREGTRFRGDGKRTVAVVVAGVVFSS